MLGAGSRTPERTTRISCCCCSPESVESCHSSTIDAPPVRGRPTLPATEFLAKPAVATPCKRAFARRGWRLRQGAEYL